MSVFVGDFVAVVEEDVAILDDRLSGERKDNIVMKIVCFLKEDGIVEGVFSGEGICDLQG